MNDQYDIGDSPTVTATFKDSAGVTTDPTEVTVRYRTPNEPTTTLTPVSNPAPGVYSVVVPPFAVAGTHRVKFFGTGALVAAEEIAIRVRGSKVDAPT